MEKIIIYHGSKDIIKKPLFGLGKLYNDYGQGFYCTENLELAKEWASTFDFNGYANKYELDLNGLSVLDLSDSKYTILNWIAILLENRIVNLSTPIQYEARDYIIKHFLPDYKKYDVIYGYRADDSCFMFARAFISNEISLSQLGYAMKLGKLGYQYCIKSNKAFNKLKFIDSVEVDNNEYKAKKIERDNEARTRYQKQTSKIDLEGLFIRDIIRDGIKNEDSKL